MAERTMRWWHSLTTTEAGAHAAGDPVLVLPLAAIEQHGPHLPLSTDLDIGLGLLRAAFASLPHDFPAWALPPQSVGCSREHGRFPGTLSVQPELLVGLIEATGAALARHGVRRLILFNSHGGNLRALDDAGLRLRDEHGILVVKASWFLFPRPDETGFPQAEWRHGIHGGAVETAMMMHLRPDLVRPSEVRKAQSLGEELEGTLLQIGPEGSTSFSWLAGDLSPSGLAGDPTLANVRMGERLVSHYGAVLADVIRDGRSFPLDRLADAGGASDAR